MHKVQAKKRPGGGEEGSRREIRTRAAASAQCLVAAAARKSGEIRRETGKRRVLATQCKAVFKEINQVSISLTTPQDLD